MGELTMREMEEQFGRLYRAGEYRAAYDLLTRECPRFGGPEQGIYYSWRMCAACRDGQADLGLRLFAEAIDAGYWYADGLREDEDLAPLHGLPEFERLVTISDERRAQAQAAAQPRLAVFEPAQPAATYPLLLALHGNRSNIERSADHWRSAAEQGWLVALPQSSQIMGPDHYGWNDRDQAVGEILRHLDALRERYPIDPDRIVVAGFSMGGGVAAWTALSAAIPARGLIGVAAFLPDVAGLTTLVELRGGQPLRTYLVASQRDAFCYEVARQLSALLDTHDLACELELHPDVGHDFPPEFARSLEQALAFITAEERR